MASLDPGTQQYLRALSYRFPTPEAALAEVSHLRAVLTLPRGTVHVVSDVHGEFQKLEHILRNGSGTLRALVEQVLGQAGEGGREPLDEGVRTTLLNLVYYPRETFARVIAKVEGRQARDALVRDTLLRELELMRHLVARHSMRHAGRILEAPYDTVFSELLYSPVFARDPVYVDALIAPFLADDGGLELLRAAAHALRSFASYEVVVGGDLGDRGPRLDRVIDALRRQRNLSITWGNHDAEWMGACLGQEALIATVLRISLRYGRISQLEEGYGIPVEPLELLARALYADDPATRFKAKGEDLREPLLLARMQKAAAILQFKLEGQTTRRNPHFELDHRNLLHRIDPRAGTVTIDDRAYPLLDRAFPSIDFSDPYRLHPEEAKCLERLKQSFLDSPSLWRDMRFVADRGGMYLVRDENLVFHGCVPVDAQGELLSFPVDGEPCKGKAMFDAIDRVVRRAFRTRETADVDLLYYLWAGPRSPLFGKDKMAMFETYFVEDKAAHKETKGAYFQLIHDASFCRKVATEFGVTPPDKVLIVNGHVPVKLEAGESPLKKSGLAVTIDGAFSEAYGDHGYTLVIDADRTYLAMHHHFESIDSAIEHGADIVPTIEELRSSPLRRVADTTSGASLRAEIAGLERLVQAYRDHEIEPPTT
jgi:fructose-1,6-bisphosphatase-3